MRVGRVCANWVVSQRVSRKNAGEVSWENYLHCVLKNERRHFANETLCLLFPAREGYMGWYFLCHIPATRLRRHSSTLHILSPAAAEKNIQKHLHVSIKEMFSTVSLLSLDQWSNGVAGSLLLHPPLGHIGKMIKPNNNINMSIQISEKAA